jgi:sulfite reductase beta subunit-like hemoprotein
MQREGGLALDFVAGGHEAIGLGFVAGAEGFLLAGLEVLTVVGAPIPSEDAVTVVHAIVHSQA